MTAPSQYTVSSLESLLNGLSINDQEPDHEEILKHANNVLKSAKNNPRALHTKVVALLHLERHQDALRIFEGPASQSIAEIAPLELAYCLYKADKLKEALELAQKHSTSGPNSRAFKHIAAQAYYRLENFEETTRIFQELAKSSCEAPNEEGDLRVNTGATDAQLVWAGKRGVVGDKKTPREDLDIFEATFNAACFSIAKGEFGQAAVLLKRARQLCEGFEDLTPEEKLGELEPITAQEIYALTRTGQLERAADLVKKFDAENVSDDALKVISAVNASSVYCQLDGYNPYMAWNKYSEAKKKVTTLSSRPFGFQAQLLLLNEIILDLNIGKTDAAKNQAKAYHNKYPSDKYVNVLNAAAKTTNSAGRDVSKKIEQMFEVNQQDIGLALTLVQLRMASDNITGSIEILQKLFDNLEPSMKYQPGLVGLLVALYETQGRKKHINDILLKASEWSRSTPRPNTEILRAAGKSMLGSESEAGLSSAGQLFASLLETNTHDPISAAGLVAAYATINPSKITDQLNTLTPVEKLISDVDVDALEAAGVAQTQRKRGAEDARPSTRPTKVRKKKPRLPKDLDPSKKVDPERWLPLRDRSYYKPKGQKGKKKAAAATQGGPVEESMELAGGGRVDVVKVEQAKKTGGGGGANKKKKKKGGKW